MAAILSFYLFSLLILYALLISVLFFLTFMFFVYNFCLSIYYYYFVLNLLYVKKILIVNIVQLYNFSFF